MSNRKFIRVFIIAFFAIMLFVAAGNHFIDPYGLHFHNRYEGFNKHKPSFLHYTRLVKLYNADAIDPNTLFLGNSRILYMMPEKAFAEYIPGRYYNWAMSGGTPNEMEDLLKYSIRNYSVKNVVYGVDFISFLSWIGKYTHTFDPKLVAGEKSMFIEFLKLHTSTQAVEESYKCLKSNITDPEGRNVKYHYNKWGSRTNAWREMNYERLGKTWMNTLFKQSLDNYTPIYNDPNMHIPEYKKLAYISIMDLCKENNISYISFIDPISADLFKVLTTSSSYPLYIDFLRFLATHGGIWYYGGVNEFTSNRDNFWDSHHARKSLGTFISNPMFMDDAPSYVSPMFGTFYDDNNIEMLISVLDSLRTEWLVEE